MHGHEEKSSNEISTSDINQTTVKDIDLSSVSKLLFTPKGHCEVNFHRQTPFLSSFV